MVRREASAPVLDCSRGVHIHADQLAEKPPVKLQRQIIWGGGVSIHDDLLAENFPVKYQRQILGMGGRYPWRPAVPLAYNVGREASNTLCVVCITCLHLSLINVF